MEKSALSYRRMALSCLVALQIALPSTLFAQSRQVTDEEREVLREWSSLEHGKGVLLTPPRGRLRAEALEARGYILKIVENLAGEDLRKKGSKFVVNIYAKDEPNAWVQEFDTNNENSPWTKFSKTLRSLLGFQDSTENFYELGFTTGLLRVLETEGELAFVVGHELTHLLEGHTHHKEGHGRFEKWWSSQSNETVADHLSVERMIGKYELQAATSALVKIHQLDTKKNSTDRDWISAISAAASTHHHEGVRISLVQFFTEYLRRNRKEAKPLDDPLLAASLKIAANGKRQVLTKPLSKTEDFFAVLQSHFLENKPLPYLFGDEVALDSFESIEKARAQMATKDKTLEEFFEENPTANQIRAIFFESLRRIETSGKPKATQVNALILTLTLFKKFAGSETAAFMNGLNDHEVFALKKWFAERSAGTDGWNLETLKPQLGNLLHQDEHHIDAIFIDTINGQNILSSLIKSFPSWKGFFDYITDLSPYLRKWDADTVQVSRKIAFYVPDGKLREAYSQRIVEQLEKLDPRRFVNHEYKPGYSAYRYLSNAISILAKNLSTTTRFTDLADRWRPVVVPRLVEQAAKTLTNRSLPNEARYNGIMSIELDDGKAVALTDRYKQAFIEFLHDETDRADYFSYGLDLEIQAVYYVVEQILTDSKISRSDQVLALKYLMKRQPANWAPLLWRSADPEKTKSVFQSFLRSLTESEVDYVAMSQFPSMERAMKFLEEGLPPSTLTSPERSRWMKDNFSSAPPDVRMKRIKMMMLPNIYPNDLPSFLLLMIQTDSTSALGTLRFNDVREYALKMNRELARSNYAIGFGRFREELPQTVHKDTLNYLIRALGEDSDPSVKFETWFDTYQKLVELGGKGYLPPDELRSHARIRVERHIRTLSKASRFQWMKNYLVRETVSPEFLAAELTEYVKSVSNGRDRDQLKLHLARIEESLRLQDKHPEAGALLRTAVAKHFRLQPNEVSNIFPEDERTATEQANGYSNHIRGLSGIIAFSRSHSIEQQIDLIEYVMGRNEQIPSFVTQAEAKMGKYSTNGASLVQVIQIARKELFYRSPLERAFAVNSLLAGPNGPSESNVSELVNHILRNISEENRPLARELANGLIEAEGANRSFVLAYVLSQVPEKENGTLTEALVFKSLLDAYGVPGVKLGQYLAFSNLFNGYQKLFEKYQNAALPLNYYEAIRLIEKKFGASWNSARYRVVRVLGSGSVNVAIEYEDLVTGENDVLSLSRDEIETKTREDFRRFRNFIASLTKNNSGREKFSFLTGLLDIVKRSVELEFSKSSALIMQKMAQRLYSRQVNGWTVRTVDAYEVLNSGLFMEKAPGKGATDVLHDAPETYKSAMGALAEVEYDILRGLSRSNATVPESLFANPDLHDGQVLIDAENKTVTILDFGQAIEITNDERLFALDILRIVSNVESAESAAKLLDQNSKLIRSQNFAIDRDAIAEAIAKEDRMDRFVHLISLVERSGFEIPLSTIHWVLAANRLIVLGTKIGVDTESMFRNLVAARKMGMPIHYYNSARLAWRNVRGFFTGEVNRDIPVTVDPPRRRSLEYDAFMCRRAFSR